MCRGDRFWVIDVEAIIEMFLLRLMNSIGNGFTQRLVIDLLCE